MIIFSYSLNNEVLFVASVEYWSIDRVDCWAGPEGQTGTGAGALRVGGGECHVFIACIWQQGAGKRVARGKRAESRPGLGCYWGPVPSVSKLPRGLSCRLSLSHSWPGCNGAVAMDTPACDVARFIYISLNIYSIVNCQKPIQSTGYWCF